MTARPRLRRARRGQQLRENHTLTNLNLENNELGEGVKSTVRLSWGNRGGTSAEVRELVGLTDEDD